MCLISKPPFLHKLIALLTESSRGCFVFVFRHEDALNFVSSDIARKKGNLLTIMASVNSRVLLSIVIFLL